MLLKQMNGTELQSCEFSLVQFSWLAFYNMNKLAVQLILILFGLVHEMYKASSLQLFFYFVCFVRALSYLFLQNCE